MRGKTRPDAARDPAAVLEALGAVWSPDFDAYASGQLDASRIRCVLCQHAPCDCPPFGTSEYLALMDARLGRDRRGGELLPERMRGGVVTFYSAEPNVIAAPAGHPTQPQRATAAVHDGGDR